MVDKQFSVQNTPASYLMMQILQLRKLAGEYLEAFVLQMDSVIRIKIRDASGTVPFQLEDPVRMIERWSSICNEHWRDVFLVKEVTGHAISSFVDIIANYKVK